jgi:WD40-like Beta Propeller Repeat
MVYNRAYKIILLTFALLFVCINTNAQYASEDELKKAADNYFVEQDYIKALPLFSQLLSLYPKDVNYNYKYGTSFFFAKREKDDALKFLKFATSKATVDPKAYFYLGLVYHHNYQFSAAEINYKKFKEKGNPKDVAELGVDRNIEMCKNGLRLLKSMTDIGVLYKKEIKATEFFRSYDLKGIGGKIIVKPDEFKTKLDIKKNETSLIHLGDQPKMVIFSSYGNDGKTGKDIYRVIKLPNGEWSKPASIGEGINTIFDEDYPFLHPDGKTLYFSSKGYNSMGGYDIFKSELNQETGQWSFPENLDFPINTPDDDILFISDIDNELAFFASSRASMQGELTVYKVQVDAQPSENSIVKGIFIAESNPNLKAATISIVDVEKERTYGVYKTDDKSGDYLLVFPSNGGKYKILVETTDNAPIHSAVIELPVLEGFRALKQELRLVGEGDDEKLVVKNLFDESDEFDITDPLIVENLLKIKAKMDVNITEEELLAKANNKNIASASDYADLSNEELKSTSVKQADKIIEKAKTSRNQANYSYQLANQKSIKAKELFAQSRNLEKEAENESDEGIKQQKLNEAKKAKNKAAGFVNETLAALNLAKALESEAVERESDVENVKALKAEISSSIDAGNRIGAEEKYAKLEEITEAAYQNQSVINTEKELLENKFTEKEIAYNKARNEVIELTNREIELNGSIESIESKIVSTTKKNDKADLESQLSALKIDLEDVKYDLGVAKTNESKLKTEYTTIKNNTATAEKVLETVSASNPKNNVGTIDKLALSNDVAFFEKEGLVGLYLEEEIDTTLNTNEEETANNETDYNLVEHKDEYSIVNEEGIIKDYNTEFSSALVDAENETNERQKSLQLAKVNQDWVNAIDEEITISKKQAEISPDLNEKVKLKSKIEKLNNLKEEKQKQAELQLLIAETLNNSSDENEVAEVNSDSEFNVIDDEGNVTDYEKDFTEELASLDNEDFSAENKAKKVAVYKNWSNAIEQQVLLEKVALENANEDEKLGIEQKIAELEAKLQANEDSIAQLENESSKAIVDEENLTNTSTIANPAKYSKEVVAENGEVLDYSSTYENELNSTDNKELLTQNWIKAIDEEINYRKDQIAATTDDDEKAVFASRINELNALKNEKQEALVDYQLAANNTSNTQDETNTLLTNPTKPVITPVTNPTVYSSSPKDEKLNVNYNAEYNYNSTQSNRELATVDKLKDEAINLYAQADEKTISLVSIKDIAEREAVITEINQIKEEAQAKEVKVANVYARTNKAEFYNNQEVLSKVRANSIKNSDNATIAEMLVDESNTYFEQAINERAKAENASSFTSKESSLQKAYNLELQALAKQTNAIIAYSDNKNIDNVYAEVNENPSSKSIENNTIGSTNNSNNNNSNINIVDNSENVSSTSSPASKISTTPIYQPLAISLPSHQERIKGDVINKEADELEANAKVLNDSATIVTNKKEQEDLVSQANDLTDEANKKRTEADVFYAKATEMETTEVELVDELNENRNSLSIEKITKEDEAIIASISSDELATITNSPDFKKYSEAKQSSRRLIKAAEVDYIQADKFQQEAEDEKTLGISLNALAAGAQGDAKIKLEGQLKKLEAMIAENEAKANEARKSATEKEQIALRKTKEAEVILVSNNQNANKLVAIEKAKAYDANLLANVGSNVRTSNEVESEELVTNESEEVVENNITETVGNSEVVNEVESEELATNESEEVLANNTTESVVNNEVVNEIESEELATNESEEVVENNTTETVGNNEVVNEVESEEIATNESEEVVENNTTETVGNNEVVNEVESEEIATNESEEVVENNTTKSVGNNEVVNEIESEEAVVNSQGNSSGSNNATKQTNVNINEIPKILTSPIFVFNGNNKSEYSNSNPIPGVEILPEGLVFKVQIGAFRNPIPQDQFKGFAPIMVEDAGNGIKRYTAGFFKTINMAVEAKNSIKSIGYEDAFVVAFYNGKRISINEAKAKLGETVGDENTVASTNNTPQNNVNNNNTNNNQTNNNTLPLTTTKAPEVATNYEEVKDGVSTDVHKIEGTFFTIQVGVYSKPVAADQLSNVTPLNSEKTANGLIRYTSGVYKNLDDANVAKDRVRGLGITDAFVIAYANGNRVKVSEALEYLKTPENNSSTSNEEIENNTTSSVGNNTITNSSENLPEVNNSTTNIEDENSSTSIEANNVTNSPNEESTSNNTTVPVIKEPIDQVKVGKELNIEFKVLLGEYEDDIPVDEAAVYLKLSGKGMEIKEVDGKSRYTIGAYPDYPSALDMQLEMKKEGIRKPQVIAFKDGMKIEVEEALELVKNNN